MTNGNEIKENFILRLFDSIKESNINVINTISKQTDALDSLSIIVKEGVRNEELKEIIKEHAKSSESLLYKLFSKVNIMIACVSIAFTISAVSYFFIKSSVDHTIDKKIGQYNISMKKDETNRESDHSDIEDQINKIFKKIEELQKDEKYGPTK